MNAAVQLLMAFLLAQPATPVAPEEQEEEAIDHDGAHGWHCWAVVAMAGQKGTVARDFGDMGGLFAHSPYRMETRREKANPSSMSWAVDPRPVGPPKGKKRRWPFAVRESDAFRNGPASITIDIEGVPVAPVGPVWAQFWGDGAYVGAQMAMKAGRVRRFFGSERQTRFAVVPEAALVARLASARTWTVVAVDGTGRRFASDTFEVPTPSEAEAAFRRARARIDSLESRFVADHRAVDEGDAGCSDHEDPLATI